MWYWVSKFKAKPVSPPVHIVPVEVQGSVEGTGKSLSIRVGEAVVEVSPGYDPDLLRNVVRTLASLC